MKVDVDVIFYDTTSLHSEVDVDVSQLLAVDRGIETHESDGDGSPVSQIASRNRWSQVRRVEGRCTLIVTIVP